MYKVRVRTTCTYIDRGVNAVKVTTLMFEWEKRNVRR